jgi:hypothetical protein
MKSKDFPLIRQSTQCPLYGGQGAGLWCRGVKSAGALTCFDCQSVRDHPDVMQVIKNREIELRRGR